MASQAEKELKKCLLTYAPAVRKTVAALRRYNRDLFPGANELIYDNYNAVAIGWSVTDKLPHTFISLAVYTAYVQYGFYYGNKLRDPEKKLQGKGNQYRYIIVEDMERFPEKYIRKLAQQAHTNALAMLKGAVPPITGATIIKSISPVKKRPVKNNPR